MCNLSTQSAVVNNDMAAVQQLVQQSTLAKENLVTAKELFGDDHPATRMAHSLYLQSIDLAMQRYRVMATNTLSYLDAALA